MTKNPRRQSFSERMGLVQPRATFQTTEMSGRLRNRLFNCVILHGPGLAEKEGFQTRPSAFGFFVWDRFWGGTLAELAAERLGPALRQLFETGSWNQVYEFLEFIPQWAEHGDWNAEAYTGACNGVLEEELAGYRFVGGVLVRVTDEIELQSLEEGLAVAEESTRDHLKRALALFADRENPNYAKCIHEAMSAVEVQLRELTGKSKVSDGVAQLKTRGGSEHHKALSGAIEKLYGWTSDDAGGIRHASKGGEQPSQALAKFALVTCSAFVNYLEELRAGGAGVATES